MNANRQNSVPELLPWWRDPFCIALNLAVAVMFLTIGVPSIIGLSRYMWFIAFH